MSAAFRRSFDSLNIPNYRRYFAGQLVSLSGNWMQIVAEMWLILTLTGSAFAVGLTTALQFLPMLLFATWGGLLADRMSKRRLLLITQALMVIPALTLWGLTAGGVVEAWMVYALVFARGAVNAVDNPTRQSFVTEMVGLRARGQRGRPEQRADPRRADLRARDRGRVDRDGGARGLLPAQLPDLRWR